MKYRRMKDLRVDHDLTQQEVADKLFCQRNVYRRYESGEREVPVQVVEKLAQYYHVSTDYLLGLTDVKTPYPPPKKRDRIADTLMRKNDDTTVRSAVARNNNTPATVLEALAKDEAAVVRWTVARNENTPSAVLESLAKDEAAYIRREVARNENTPSAVLETLAKDEDANVRWYANKKLGNQPCISSSDLTEAKAEKDVRDATAPKQKKEKNQEQGLE